jgi:endonuclease/exonuclease/phosphatase (EEP) superfamily protein YafD
MEPRRVIAGVLTAGALVPAVALTAGRLAQPTYGPSVVLEAFTPYAVPLLVVTLIVALVAYRASTRKVLVGGVVGLLALHAWWLHPLYSGAAAEAGRNTFTLMTSNLLVGHASPSSLMKAVVDEDVDVLVVQELGYNQYVELQRLGLDDAMPYHSNAQKWLQGTVVFSRYPLSDEQALDLSQGGQKLTVAVPGHPLTLVAVHSRRARWGGASGWLDDQHTILVAARAARGPAVIAGDFNASLDHEALRRVETAGFRDSADVIGAGWQPTWPSDAKVTFLSIPVPPFFRIDHVLVDDRVRVSGSWTRTIQGTDHRAVIARLTVR